MLVTTKNSVYRVLDRPTGEYSIAKLSEIKPSAFYPVGHITTAKHLTVRLGESMKFLDLNRGWVYTSKVIAIACGNQPTKGGEQ